MKINSYNVEEGERFNPPEAGLPPFNYDPKIHKVSYMSGTRLTEIYHPDTPLWSPLLNTLLNAR